MDIAYADRSIAIRQSRFSFPVLIFVAAWLGVLVAPPLLYMPLVEGVYHGTKVEMPSVTKTMLSLNYLNQRFAWVWLAVPFIAAIAAPRFSHPPADEMAAIRRRQDWLHAGMVLTLIAMVSAMVQLAILLAPWIAIGIDVAGE